MEDNLDEMRRPRSKKYLAMVRALRMNYDVLAEYEKMLEQSVQEQTEDSLVSIVAKVNAIEIQAIW